MKSIHRQNGLVPDADAITLFRGRPGVWLTFAGSAYLQLYTQLLRPHDLRPGWVTALALVDETPGLSQSALARALCINRASAMALATNLEALDYIQREDLPGRNRKGLTLRPLGKERLETACRLESELSTRLLSGIDDAQIDTFMAVLRDLTASLNQGEPDG